MNNKDLESCSAKLSPETFLAFHISTMEKVTKDTYLVRFTLPGNSRLGLRPGQHLILRGEGNHSNDPQTAHSIGVLSDVLFGRRPVKSHH